MRDVIDDLARWWAAGESVGLGTVVGTWKSSPRQPGAAMLVGPDGTAVGSVSGGCVEGAVYALGRDHAGRRQTRPAAIRRQRRRRLRGRPHVRRDHRHLRRAGQPRDLPAVGCDRRRHPARPSGRRRDGDQRRRRAGRTPAGRPSGFGRGDVGQRAARRRRARRRARPARAGHDGDRPLRPARRATPRRHRCVRGVLRAEAAHDRVRRDRLRGGGGTGRRVPRLLRDRLRCPRDVCHREAIPGRRRGGRRVAASLSRPDRGRRAHRACAC